MAEFACNNAGNAIICHIFFEPNYNYHPQIFLKDKVDPCLRVHSARKPAMELKDFISICQQNPLHAQKL